MGKNLDTRILVKGNVGNFHIYLNTTLRADENSPASFNYEGLGLNQTVESRPCKAWV